MLFAFICLREKVLIAVVVALGVISFAETIFFNLRELSCFLSRIKKKDPEIKLLFSESHNGHTPLHLQRQWRLDYS